ncbi:MAG: fibronectin type III domain-containing protein [Chitinophagaceae bacterium]
MKKLITLLTYLVPCFIFQLKPQAQTQLIAGWDFQTTTTGGTAAAAAPGSPLLYNANFGSGTMYLNGTNGSSTWTSITPSPQVTAFNGTASVNAGAGFSTIVTVGALAVANSSANGFAITFQINMSSYKDLNITYATQGTGTGFTSQVWDYSVDGTNWVNVTSITSIPSSFGLKTVPTITGLDFQSTAFLRLTLDGASGAGGNNRLDNIQFNATGPLCPVIENDITLATTNNASSTVGTSSKTSTQADGTSIDYTDVGCHLLASIADASGGNAMGSTTVDHYVASAFDLSSLNGRMLGKRYVTVTPTSTGPASVTLYYTQADFDEYNDYNTNTLSNFYLPLPTSGSNSDPNISYFRIAKKNGSTFAGSLQSLSWNSTSLRWEVTMTTTDVSGTYYFYTMPSCNGVVVNNLATGAVNGTSVSLTWDAVSNLVSGWYDLQIENVTDNPGVFTSAGTASNTATSKTIINLLPGKNYNVQIRRACSSQSTGAWSSSLNFTTPSLCASPSVSISSISYNAVELSWSSVANAQWYRTRYRELPSGAWSTITTTNGISKLFTNLNPNTNFEFQVATVCTYPEVSAWTTVSATTSSTCTTPSNIAVALISATEATITWDASTSALWYLIQYREVGTSTWIIKSTNTNLKKLINLSPSTTYEFSVKAKCSSTTIDESAWSTPQTFTLGAGNRMAHTTFTNNLSIYPNPTNGIVYLDIQSTHSTSCTIKLLDVTGRVQFEKQEDLNEGTNPLSYEFGYLPKGIYQLIIKKENDADTYFQKVILQ